MNINIDLLKRALNVIRNEGPIPVHKLATKLDVHPATVRTNLTKARDLLGIHAHTSSKGYVGVIESKYMDVDRWLDA